MIKPQKLRDIIVAYNAEFVERISPSNQVLGVPDYVDAFLNHGENPLREFLSTVEPGCMMSVAISLSVQQRKPASPPETFKIGDIVHLNSGGPRLTVWGVRPDGGINNGGLVDVSWFDGRDLKRDAFSPEEIRKEQSL